MHTLLLWLLFPLGMLMFGYAVDDDDEHLFLGGLGLAAITLWCYLAQFNPYTFAKANWLLTAKMAGAYIILGIGWSMIKVYAQARKLEKPEVVDPAGNTKEMMRISFDAIMRRTYIWIALWPASLTWALASDWMKGLFVWISDMFEKVYKEIFRRAVRRHLK